jgi:hypothetical protein
MGPWEERQEVGLALTVVKLPKKPWQVWILLATVIGAGIFTNNTCHCKDKLMLL